MLRNVLLKNNSFDFTLLSFFHSEKLPYLFPESLKGSLVLLSCEELSHNLQESCPKKCFKAVLTVVLSSKTKYLNRKDETLYIHLTMKIQYGTFQFHSGYMDE